MYPEITLWLHLKKKPLLWSQCIQQSNCDYIWKENSTKTSGFFVKENPGFFHKVPCNVIIMYPTIYSKSSLRVCGKIEPQCDFIVVSLRKICWGHYDYIAEYFVKELSMSGSDSGWIHCKQNCERNQGFLSQRTHWLLCCFLFKCNHNLITGYIVIKVVFFFQM